MEREQMRTTKEQYERIKNMVHEKYPQYRDLIDDVGEILFNSQVI